MSHCVPYQQWMHLLSHAIIIWQQRSILILALLINVLCLIRIWTKHHHRPRTKEFPDISRCARTRIINAIYYGPMKYETGCDILQAKGRSYQQCSIRSSYGASILPKSLKYDQEISRLYCIGRLALMDRYSCIYDWQCIPLKSFKTSTFSQVYLIFKIWKQGASFIDAARLKPFASSVDYDSH